LATGGCQIDWAHNVTLIEKVKDLVCAHSECAWQNASTFGIRLVLAAFGLSDPLHGFVALDECKVQNEE